MSKRKWIFVAAPFGFVLFVALGGTIVQQLWNWLAPALFGLPYLTFWQALGLLALCRILFGGFGGGMHGGRRRDRMSPEDRERLRERLRTRSGESGESGEPA